MHIKKPNYQPTLNLDKSVDVYIDIHKIIFDLSDSFVSFMYVKHMSRREEQYTW